VEDIAIALIGALTTIALALIRIFSRRREQKGKDASDVTTQKNLLQALKDTVEIQAQQIKTLKDVIEGQQNQLILKDEEIRSLTERVSNLEQLTIKQALIIGQQNSETSGMVDNV